ncbi:hypothetical protein BDR03DRAFT_986454 [Suillus americanus]|nr:hypothetical protein BDR03DRAFT_986454 [Suillus americanus]
MSKFYVCSASCNQTFTKFTDLKKHEATYSMDGYFCTWPGCYFATMSKYSSVIHYNKHMGEQRCVCPHDDCDYKTHDPALLTKHRKKEHGYIPLLRGRGASSAKGSQPLAQPHLSAQPFPPASPTYPQPIIGCLMRSIRYRERVYHVYRTREGPKWVD